MLEALAIILGLLDHLQPGTNVYEQNQVSSWETLFLHMTLHTYTETFTTSIFTNVCI